MVICMYLKAFYAAAPLGKLRFMPPQSPEAWDEVRYAEQFSAAAPQLISAEQQAVYTQAEDCLYLNIWTPAVQGAKSSEASSNGKSSKDKEQKARPVVVYIHGGAFKNGSGADVDGYSIAAEHDIVFVSINYRLGALGFLYLGELLGETYETSGNNGLLDCIAALRWVQENIRSFGGDPEIVTVAGSSAGAKLTASLLAAPAAEGLFQRAILQSGALQSVRDSRTAHMITIRLLRELGLSIGEADKLLLLDSAEIVAAQERIFDGFGGLHTFGPVIDGQIIQVAPLDYVRLGKSKHISLLIGANKDEVNQAVNEDPRLRTGNQSILLDLFGQHSDWVWHAYEKRSKASQQRLAWSTVLTDCLYRVPALQLATVHSEAGGKVFMYHFTFANEFGATHAYETHFIYDYAESHAQTLPDEAKPLRDMMRQAWCCFIAEGKPCASELPEWKPFTSESLQAMSLGEASSMQLFAVEEDVNGFPTQVIKLLPEKASK